MATARVFVLGNIGLETHLRLDSLPLENSSSYKPGGLELSPSGVGFNLALALHTLGCEVSFGSVLGSDLPGGMLRLELACAGLVPDFIYSGRRTARSLVLTDAQGTRHVHTDLGGAMDVHYPPELFDKGVRGAQLALLSNIGYSRPLLARALNAGTPISTDLHAIKNLENPYDEAFLAAATLLFFSAEHLGDPVATVGELRRRFNPEIIVVGLGAEGALLSERAQPLCQLPAFRAPRVLSTVGAGDALHAAFCYFWLRGEVPAEALRLACAFAALKLGGGSGSAGFVSEAEVRRFATSNPLL